MPRLPKRILFIIGGAAALLVLALLVAVLLVDVNQHKPRLEAAATEALGMDVRFGGRLRLGFFPGLHLTAEDAQVRDERGAVVASAKRIRFGLALLPLLRREIRLSRLDVSQPRLAMERSAEGTLNVARLERAVALVGMLDGAGVTLADGAFLYADARSGQRIEAAGFGLKVKHLRLGSAKGAGRLAGLSLAAELDCREIRTKDFTVSALKTSVSGKDGVLRFAPVTLGLFGGQGTGSLDADLTGPVPRYRLRFSLPGFRVEQFLAVLSPNRGAEGAMDFSANLTMQGASAAQLVGTAAGEVSLRGGALKLVGNDLDRMLSRFESSQGFNLVDVGAVFFAGPLGLAVTKGYGFASLFRPSGGDTEIRTLVSDWKVGGGVARAQDVALATTRNRIALQGGLDIARGRYADLTVAAIDDGGCVRVQQVIRGSFAKPEVEKPRVLASLAGPVMKVVRQTRGLFPRGPCEVFYAGSVPPPN